MKTMIVLLGALLSATSFSATAQSGMTTDEGRPHTSNAPTRELTRMCRAEAKDKQLTGKERKRFLRDCQANEVAPVGSSDSGTVRSGSENLNDADGRPK